jgi:hypothetical protein
MIHFDRYALAGRGIPPAGNGAMAAANCATTLVTMLLGGEAARWVYMDAYLIRDL